MLLFAIISLLSVIGGLALGSVQADQNERAQRDANDTNLQMNRETNETNVQLQEMANTANVQQAELAYQRSLPINQVRDLMNAGVSKSAALQKLTGGGLYSAPVMSSAQTQAGSVNPVLKDYSKLSEAFQQLGNIPANVQQSQMTEQSLKNLKLEYQNHLSEEKRKQELHEFDLWSRQYGKDNATALDTATNLVLNKLLDSDKEITDFKSFESLIRDLGLSSEPILRRLPSAARAQVESAVRDRFADARAAQQQENANRAAYDAHEIAELRKEIERINVKYYDKEKHEQLLNLMRIGEGLIQDNNIKFQDMTAKEQENYVRSAGIEDEAQARAAAEYARRLQNEDKLFVADKADKYPNGMKHFRAGVRLFLSDLGEILSKVQL